MVWLYEKSGGDDLDTPLEKRREADEKSLFGMRAWTRQPSARSVTAVDYPVPVEGGVINVRIYRPASNAILPVHLYMHGGGFWMGSVAGEEPLCRWYAHSVGCAVASVEYRLPPEYPYPTPPEDCYAALCWLAQHANELGLDASRISVGGVSAGGGLAAVVALMARDRRGPPLIFQLLEIPVTDTTMSQPSVDTYASGYGLTRTWLAAAYASYLRAPEQAKEPYASPLLAPNLAGLPPAFVATAEYDPLRDEGENYAKRLQEAGVPMQLRRYIGHLHSSTYMTRLMPSARKAVAEACAALRAAYGLSAD